MNEPMFIWVCMLYALIITSAVVVFVKKDKKRKAMQNFLDEQINESVRLLDEHYKKSTGRSPTLLTGLHRS
jgi:hypothetical protein